jgi:hydroxypyruvate isomerase
MGNKWSAEQLIEHAAMLGLAGTELLDVEHWHLLKKHGMVNAATKSHGFIKGMNNKAHHPECLKLLEQAIKDTGDAGFPNVMTFTGMADTTKEGGSIVSLEEGKANCIEGYKKIIGLAEKHKVNLILEPLNTAVSDEMKGHPGYQGDHIDYCMEIVKAVDSPSVKILFDAYHIQLMDGNLIQRLKQYADYIAHVQMAGVPGRGELGADQEINYPALMKTLLEIGYTGYVGHEWIPTKEPVTGLTEAVRICDV